MHGRCVSEGALSNALRLVSAVFALAESMMPEESTATPLKRYPTWPFVVSAVLFGLLNVWVSVIAVALAVPGSGSPGPGFKVIAAVFLVGNIFSFGWALRSAWGLRRRRQILGLVLQLLTLPMCFALALSILWAFDISML